ncbi:MAG: efflux RND transporter periplasmic adaptor subunit [Gemmatimonadaceae bacterium]
MKTSRFRTIRLQLRELYTGVLLAILGILIAGCREAQPAPPPPQVTVAPAAVREVADADEFTGHFEAVNTVDVRPRVGGYVQRVAFVEGATVHEGDVLFTIDARPYEAEVSRAEAELERARTRKQLADMELERAQRLVSTQAISREELDARTSGRAEGDASIRAAEAAVRVARLNLEWTVVRAPITGRVGRAEVTAGNLVQTGPGAPTLTTIVSLDPIYVYFDSDEQAYLKYMQSNRASGASSIGRPIYVGLANEPGFPHEGKLDFIDNRVDRTAGTIRVRGVLPNASHQFAPGLFARVRLVGGERHQATLIQDQAIGTDQDRKFVLVLKSDNTLEYRPITIGRMVDGLRSVESGVAPGDRVVINGLMRVRPGMKVVAQTTDMTKDVAALTR